MNPKEAELAEDLRKKWSARMTEAEVEFLRDIAGFIDFAIRNGLIFPTTLAAIVHDVNEVARTGFDYGSARAHGFRPKVEGFRNITANALDGAETEDDE